MTGSKQLLRSLIENTPSINPLVELDLFLKTFKAQEFSKDNCRVFCADSRDILPSLPDNSISCTISSPPYGELKDYGTENQIGFGQNWEKEYLPDLKKIFGELFRITRSGGAMWIVLDTIKEQGETKPLPWEVVLLARASGWTFHDLVIWDKGKNLPWSHTGRFRGVCEYILLFGKGKLKNFNLDSARDSDNLSSYWVKYPERYHPDGKAPSDLWHFPIPVQGSWSKKQSRHLCPFPLGLVARMIRISTEPGDVVLDPFAGTCSVPTIASYLGRFGLGVEINPHFVEDFDSDGFDLITNNAKNELLRGDDSSHTLRSTIIQLRMLKYAKTLFSGLTRIDQLGNKAHESVGAFLLRSTSQLPDRKTLDPSNLGQIDLEILLKMDADKVAIENSVKDRVGVAPLTVFGISANITIVPFEVWNTDAFIFDRPDSAWYSYTAGKFFAFSKEINSVNLKGAIHEEINLPPKRMPSIFSRLKLNVKIPLTD